VPAPPISTSTAGVLDGKTSVLLLSSLRFDSQRRRGTIHHPICSPLDL
jgi:hypothetical protein